MGLSSKHLAEGEDVVVVLRTHVKAIFLPIMIGVLLTATVITVSMMAASRHPVLMWIAVGLAIVVALIWVVAPVLRWSLTDYTVTTKRIALRSGIFTRRGRDIPLYRINDVTSEQNIVDRMFGCGTLVISDASDGPGLFLHDVPRIEAVRVDLHELLFAHDDGSDDGEWPPGEPGRR